MSLKLGIETAVAVTLLILGISYLLNSRRWLRFLRALAKRRERVFPLALGMVAAGAFIGAAYNDWSSTWPIFVTAIGWLLALEGGLLLTWPAVLKPLEKLSDVFLNAYLRLGGLLLVVLGALLLSR